MQNIFGYWSWIWSDLQNIFGYWSWINWICTIKLKFFYEFNKVVYVLPCFPGAGSPGADREASLKRTQPVPLARGTTSNKFTIVKPYVVHKKNFKKNLGFLCSAWFIQFFLYWPGLILFVEYFYVSLLQIEWCLPEFSKINHCTKIFSNPRKYLLILTKNRKNSI